MPVAARLRRFRVYMTLTIAAAHTTLALLGLAGRLTYSAPSRYPLLLQVMGNDIWTWFHGLAAATLLLSILVRRSEVMTLGAATGVMGAWSFLNLLWGLSVPDNPVSLVGPALGGVVAAMAYLLTLSWARADSVAPSRK